MYRQVLLVPLEDVGRVLHTGGVAEALEEANGGERSGEPVDAVLLVGERTSRDRGQTRRRRAEPEFAQRGSCASGNGDRLDLQEGSSSEARRAGLLRRRSLRVVR